MSLSYMLVKQYKSDSHKINENQSNQYDLGYNKYISHITRMVKKIGKNTILISCLFNFKSILFE